MSYDTNLRAAVRDLITVKGRLWGGEYARLVAAFNADAVGRAITDPIDSLDYKLMFDRCVAEKQALLPMPAPDPRYDARCALQDRTDWSAA